jgi:hypothetical protein
MRGVPRLAPVLLACLPASALADWTAIRLHPSGSYSTSVGGVSATNQVGFWQATPQSPIKPVIWSGSFGSMVNLAPAASDYGVLYGLSGGTQFGHLNGRASLWQGTPESRVSLHPTNAPPDSGSVVHAMRGNEQAGTFSAAAGSIHGAVWHGSAGSFVDLHAWGPRDISLAFATDGLRQGGYFQTEFGSPHAVLWSGSAASMIDLNPPGAGGSTIYGMASGQQAGIAYFGVPSIDHAVIWSGSANSWVDLNPPNSSSILAATCGTAQAGQLNGFSAAVWFGTPQSVVNLHAFLAPEYVYSVATSVYEQSGLFYVGGWAYRSGGPSQEAFLWVGVPCPSSLALLSWTGVLACRRRRPHGLHPHA